MPPRKTRSSARKAASSKATPAQKTAPKTGKAAGKSSKAVFKSAETIEYSGDEAYQTPPPRSKRDAPSTPKREKRKLALRSPESVIDSASAPSPSPTKRMRTLALNSPEKANTPVKAKAKAVPQQKPKAGVRGSARGKDKVKYVSEDEDEDEDEDENEDEYDEDEDEDENEDENEDEDETENENEDEESGGDVVDDEEEENAIQDDDEQDEVKNDDEDDPFASLGADGKPNAKRNLKDTRNICVKVLPKSDGIPTAVYDKEVMKRKPEMTLHNLKLGELASWRTQNMNGSVMTLASLAFYRTFTQDKIVINNIVNGLSFEEDHPFYNAATADPRNYVARFIPSNMLSQYEVISAKSGEPVVGIAVASFVRSTLRGDAPDKHRYRSFAVIPHRGWYERFASFHCMNFGVDSLVAQRDDSVLSFQTRNKPDSTKEDEDEDDDSTTRKTQAAFSDLEAYESPKKKTAKGSPSAARRHLGSSYKFDKTVPILDGRGVKLTFTRKGLYEHLDTLPEFKGNITLKSPCVIGYNTYGYIYNEVWKVKFNILFVIVLDLAPQK